MRYDRIGRQSPVSFARLCLCIFLAVLLTAASGLASVCFGAGTGFSDVHTWQWHAEAVARARTEGILEGYPDGTFRPDRLVTCGEFLRMSIPEAPKTSAAHWADGYYREGLHRELYTVRDIGETALDRPIARQYMALVYSRLMEESEGIQIARTEGSAVPPAPFSDVAETSAYEYPIAVVAAAGLLEGYPGGSFRPEGFLTRAEAATAFVRLLKLRDEGASGDAPPATPDEVEPSNMNSVIVSKYQEYLDRIIESLVVFGSNGNYRYEFDIPETSDELKVFFRVSFYNLQGGNLAATSKYVSKDPTPRRVSNIISGLDSLDSLGSASFNFSVAAKEANDWHDYLLKWRSNGEVNLRMQVLNDETNEMHQKYCMQDLNDIFSWI